MTRYDSLRSKGVSIMKVNAQSEDGKVLEVFEAATYNEIDSILSETKDLRYVFIDGKETTIDLIKENAYLEKAGLL